MYDTTGSRSGPGDPGRAQADTLSALADLMRLRGLPAADISFYTGGSISVHVSEGRLASKADIMAAMDAWVQAMGLTAPYTSDDFPECGGRFVGVDGKWRTHSVRVFAVYRLEAPVGGAA